jgi:hypothetical protein
MQLSPFDVLRTYQPDYSSSNGVNPETSPSGSLNYGAVGFTTDGRRFRLCSLPSTGTTLAACKLIQGPAQSASYHLGTVSAQAIGDGSVNSTSGFTSVVYTVPSSTLTVVANFFAGGFLSVVTGTGSVQQVQIAGNLAATASTTVTLILQDPLVLATAATATAELYVNAYGNPIVTPASALTGQIIGVPMVGVTVSTNSGQSTWFWAQDEGFATVLAQGTTGIGLGGSNSTSVAGAMAVVAATTPQLAIATEAGADGLYTVWNLTIQ